MAHCPANSVRFFDAMTIAQNLALGVFALNEPFSKSHVFAKICNGISLCAATLGLISMSVMAQTPVQVVEYYRAASDQYFLTGRSTEQQSLDAVPGFQRTGMRFLAASAGDATDSVCRYRIVVPSTLASTHFYGLSDDCALIARSNLANIFCEGIDFAVARRSGASTCPSATPHPVYRALREQSSIAIANHRYFTNLRTYDAAVRRGWIGEGAVFCVASSFDEQLSSTASGPSFATAEPLRSLSRLGNVSGSSERFEATLVAAPTAFQLTGSSATEFWAYNGSVPGPLIELYEGDSVRIRFENRLEQPSTIHWHGLPVPASQDGNPMDPVPPGGSRDYEFTVPVGTAGTYWYHPHTHGLTAEQVYRGLAGALVIRSRDNPLPVNVHERLLLLSDLKLAADASIASNRAADNVNGREGQYLLVNGGLQPTLDMRPGETQRWKLFNATNARYIRFAVDGVAFRQIGTDGGLTASPSGPLNELLLAPGERAEVVLTAPALPSVVRAVRALSYDRGSMGMSTSPTTVTVANLRTSTDDAVIAAVTPSSLRTITPLLLPGALAAATRRFVLSESGGMGMSASGNFLINGKSFDPLRVDTVTRVGDVERWEIQNSSQMDHPFHLHGTQFQIISRTASGREVPDSFPAWRDTVNVPPGTAVSFLVRQDQTGNRMYHCHILEHEDQGMMGVLRVDP